MGSNRVANDPTITAAAVRSLGCSALHSGSHERRFDRNAGCAGACLSLVHRCRQVSRVEPDERLPCPDGRALDHVHPYDAPHRTGLSGPGERGCRSTPEQRRDGPEDSHSELAKHHPEE